MVCRECDLKVAVMDGSILRPLLEKADFSGELTCEDCSFELNDEL